MISILLTVMFITSEIETVQCSLGVPVTIDYSIPEGFIPQPLEVTDSFVLLEQQGSSITIVPIVLDTLILPPMHAISDNQQVDEEFPPPGVVVARTMPDSTWIVPVFPSPLVHTIPPGIPLDYLQRHCFWERWGKPPPNRWLLPLILSLAAILTVILIWRIRRGQGELQSSDVSSLSGKSHSPLDEVKALLDSRAFAEGRWPEYYKDVDRLLRNTLDVRFAISNRAYTWHQIRSELTKEKSGRNFIESTEELSREIVLQRYAAWGGSRERAKKYTSMLLNIREEWHRQ